MKHEELEELIDRAWDNFLTTIERGGINRNTVLSCLDDKDCFNDVDDALRAACHKLNILEDE